jgi:hypothetical protein
MYWWSDGKIKVFISMVYWMWAWRLGSKIAWLALDKGETDSSIADRDTAVRLVGLGRKKLQGRNGSVSFGARDIPEYYTFQILSYILCA